MPKAPSNTRIIGKFFIENQPVMPTNRRITAIRLAIVAKRSIPQLMRTSIGELLESQHAHNERIVLRVGRITKFAKTQEHVNHELQKDAGSIKNRDFTQVSEALLQPSLQRDLLGESLEND